MNSNSNSSAGTPADHGEPDPQSPRNALGAILLLCLLLLAALLCGVFFIAVPGLPPSIFRPESALWVLVFVQLSLIHGVPELNRATKTAALPRRRMSNSLVIVIAAANGLAVLHWVGCWSTRDIVGQIWGSAPVWSYGDAIITSLNGILLTLLLAYWEETTFRKLFFHLFLPFLRSRALTVSLSSLLFGLWLWSWAGGGFACYVTSVAAGVIFFTLYLRTGDLGLTIFANYAWKLTLVLLGIPPYAWPWS